MRRLKLQIGWKSRNLRNKKKRLKKHQVAQVKLRLSPKREQMKSKRKSKFRKENSVF